jgi:hypothetical protein
MRLQISDFRVISLPIANCRLPIVFLLAIRIQREPPLSRQSAICNLQLAIVNQTNL